MTGHGKAEQYPPSSYERTLRFRGFDGSHLLARPWPFLLGHKRFWLAPAILVLLVVAALLALTDGLVVLPPDPGSGLVSLEP